VKSHPAILLPLALAAWASLAPSGAAVAPPRVFRFIADDYGRALAEARARKVPLFIEAWAPW